jgi:ADP-ribose pyrophosphatase YjhB (NUDIX family)
MSSLYQGTEQLPFHISVGAVIVNEKNEILVHKRIKGQVPEEFNDSFGNLAEVYLLMRESLENGETLEEAVHRGMQEEFGVKGTVEGYLGSIQVSISSSSYVWEKTTLYFKVALREIGMRPVDDEEAESVLEWHTPDFLIERMKEQSENKERPDLDESKIIEAYVRFS